MDDVSIAVSARSFSDHSDFSRYLVFIRFFFSSKFIGSNAISNLFWKTPLIIINFSTTEVEKGYLSFKYPVRYSTIRLRQLRWKERRQWYKYYEKATPVGNKKVVERWRSPPVFNEQSNNEKIKQVNQSHLSRVDFHFRNVRKQGCKFINRRITLHFILGFITRDKTEYSRQYILKMIKK